MAAWTRVRSLLSGLIPPARCRMSPVGVCCLSTCPVTASNKTCKVDLGVTHDDKAVVCFHPATDIPFELTKAIPRHDPIGDPAETHNLMLKSKLTVQTGKNKEEATIEELSQMFYTTKHRWYPVGLYHTRRRNRNPPRDR